MKALKVCLVLVLALTLLCSCEAQPGKSDSTDQSVLPSDDSVENEAIGKFGGEYTFDYHYAQTPDSFFYIKDEIVKLDKADLSRKTSLAGKTDFAIAEGDELSADIIGVTSKWLFVSVNSAWDTDNNAPLDNVYKLSHDGATVELLLETVESAYFHPGNGIIYFTKRDEKGTLGLYSFNLESKEQGTLPTGEKELSGFNWCQLKDGKIGFSGSYIIDKNNKLEIRQTEDEEKVPEDLGRDISLEEAVKGLLEEGRELLSYADCSGFIYYIDHDKDTKNAVLNRVDADGNNKTVLAENTSLCSLFSYGDKLYGDVYDADTARLVIVDENGAVTPTDVVTGVGQWGYIKIEGGLFIRTYKNPALNLVYVYNPKTGQVVKPW